MYRIIQRLLVAGLILSSTFLGWAEITLPRLIGNDMILQQKMKNTIWGWVAPGAKVTVKASWGAEGSAKADENGKWKVLLETPGHGTGHSISITCGEDSVNIKNVAIGEVWLCVGQSNMGWAAGGSFSGEECDDADLPNFRMFRAVRERWYEPLENGRDLIGNWHPMTPDYSKITSAVSFFFARKLHQELDVPVGIIIKAFAGTPVEAWMPKEAQLDDPRTSALIKQETESMTEKFSKKVQEGAMEEYRGKLEVYKDKVTKGETARKGKSLKDMEPPALSKHAGCGTQSPGTLYNAMIHPIRHYGIRGVIWYQGERNSKVPPQAANFRRQLKLLVNTYRSIFHEASGGEVAKDFPFYFTQLPSWYPAQIDPVEGAEATWAITREMMRLVTYDVPNTGISVGIDTGGPYSLHPKNKKPLGLRHAYLALKQVYGKDIVDNGPCYKKHTVDGIKVILEFDSVGSGLMAGSQGDLNSFAIAGSDQKWCWADAKIKGNTVILSSGKVKDPEAVRYAWAMNPSERNLLYNKEGLPASPFRTDDWPLFDPNVEYTEREKPKAPEGYEHTDWDRPEMTQ